jgi:hypothetical protein
MLVKVLFHNLKEQSLPFLNYLTIWKNNVYLFHLFLKFSFSLHIWRLTLKFRITRLVISDDIAAISFWIQFVCCTRPTFVDFSLHVPPEKSQAARSGERAGHGMSPSSEIRLPGNISRGTPMILSPCWRWHHPVGTTLLYFHGRSVSASGSCVTSAHNDLKLLWLFPRPP